MSTIREAPCKCGDVINYRVRSADGAQTNERKSFPGFAMIAIVILEFSWRDKERRTAASGPKIGIDSMAEAPFVGLTEKSYKVARGFCLLTSALFGDEDDINVARQIELLCSEFAERKNSNSEFGESRQPSRLEDMKIGSVAPECADIRIRCSIKIKSERTANPESMSSDLQFGMFGFWRWETEPVQAAGDGRPGLGLLEFVRAVRLKARNFAQSKAGDQ